MKARAPSEIFKAGRVTVSIWFNEETKNGKSVKIPNIVFDRYYKENGKLIYTRHFSKIDLLDLKEAVEKAYKFLCDNHL